MDNDDNLKSKISELNEEEKLAKKEEAAIKAEKQELLKQAGVIKESAAEKEKIRRLDDNRREVGIERIMTHLKNNTLLYGAAILVLIILNIWLRYALLQYAGFFEPDAFFYYAAIKQAIASGFVVSKTVAISGYPYPNGFNEAPGLLYVALIPYFFLQYVGVSAYTVERLVPILFGILCAAGSYVLVKYLSKSRMLGLLAFFFVSASSGNIARTAGTVFRGDSFISVPAILGLIFILMCIESDDDSRKYLYAIGAALSVGIGPVIWNGGVFTFAVALAAAMFIWIYCFIAGDRKLMDRLLLVMGALFLAYLFNNIFVFAGMANVNVMQGPDFLIIFGPLLVATLVGKWALTSDMTRRYTNGPAKRLAMLICIGLVLAGLAFLFFSNTLINAITDQGNLNPINNIAATTQELQKPSWSFLESSFGLQLILAPLGALLFIFLGHRTGTTSRLRLGPISLNANPGYMAMLSFGLLTAYLQYNAIRYNALLSVPLALFSAYAIYCIGRILKDENYAISLGSKFNIRIFYVYVGVVCALLLLQVSYTAAQTFSSTQADGINPQFLQAAAWLSNNTAPNATVLALWPDGSVIEGWGDRAAYEDSVGGENTSRTINFANWLANTTPDTWFLYHQAYKPDYIFVRNFWFEELGGLFAEGNSTSLEDNISNYGYAPLYSYHATGNASYQTYTFVNSAYRAELILENNATTGGKQVVALLGAVNRTNLYPIQHILFINDSNGDFTVLGTNKTGALNYTLMLTYSGTNITGSTLLAYALPYTNLFKMLVECVPEECLYNNGANVTLTMVYDNGDSRIFKVNYPNQTSNQTVNQATNQSVNQT